MRAVDVIRRKRDGLELTRDEITAFARAAADRVAADPTSTVR